MKRKVLRADDEEGVLVVVEATLGNDGTIEILVAHDGDEALRIAQQEMPQVMFLDVLMPGMNGYEVCLALKRDPATAHIKIIMLTSLDQEFDQIKALKEAGADDYIAKPFDPNMLLQKYLEATAGQ